MCDLGFGSSSIDTTGKVAILPSNAGVRVAPEQWREQLDTRRALADERGGAQAA